MDELDEYGAFNTRYGFYRELGPGLASAGSRFLLNFISSCGFGGIRTSAAIRRFVA